MVYLQNCKAVYSATRDFRLSRFYPLRERGGFSLHNDNIIDKEEQKAVKEGIDFIKEYLNIIPLDMKEVEIFASLKTKYKASTGINKNAIKRHNLDLLIASTAIALDAIIVSHDGIFKKLSKIEPLLKCEDWLE